LNTRSPGILERKPGGFFIQNREKAMPKKSRLAVFLFACVTLVPFLSYAADPSAGSACAVTGALVMTGGPESGGAGGLMVCSGGTWKSFLSYDSSANAALNYGISVTGVLSPATLSGSQNDYSPAGLPGASILRLNAGADVNVTGLAGGSDGRVITLFNTGSGNIVLKNQDSGSSALNRFAFSADIVLGADQSATLIYDATSQRWRSASIPFNVGAAPGTGYFVLTNSSWNGNLGGLSGANAKCLAELTSNTAWKYYSDANAAGLLSSAHVAAFLCQGTQCQNLSPNTTYYFARVGSATTGGGSFTTDNKYGLGPGDSSNWSGSSYFGGNFSYWTSRAGGDNLLFPMTSQSTDDCNNWSATTFHSGDLGSSATTDMRRWVNTTHSACLGSARLICAVSP
jgi:hypothetical protein